MKLQNALVEQFIVDAGFSGSDQDREDEKIGQCARVACDDICYSIHHTSLHITSGKTVCGELENFPDAGKRRRKEKCEGGLCKQISLCFFDGMYGAFQQHGHDHGAQAGEQYSAEKVNDLIVRSHASVQVENRSHRRCKVDEQQTAEKQIVPDFQDPCDDEQHHD